MALSAFDDRTRPPSPDTLRSVLGTSHAAWSRLVASITGEIGPVSEVWKFAGASTGWGMRVVRDGRVIVYITPQHRQFLVSFVLGEKAVTAAGAVKLPARLLEAIETAPRYSEGRGVRIQVRNLREVAGLTTLARIKAQS